MGKVTYIEADGASHTVEVATGENVMRGALDHDLPGIVGECGGRPRLRNLPLLRRQRLG